VAIVVSETGGVSLILDGALDTTSTPSACARLKSLVTLRRT
jgi:DNA integrity scanning protein DisA with diadenylate cyclase activity